MVLDLVDRIADFKEQYLFSEAELYSFNPQRELELNALLGRLGYRNELEIGSMMKRSLHLPAVYRICQDKKAEVFSRENLLRCVDVNPPPLSFNPPYNYFSFSNQEAFEKFDQVYQKLAELEKALEPSEKREEHPHFFVPPLVKTGGGLAGIGGIVYLIFNSSPIEYVIGLSGGMVVLYGSIEIFDSVVSSKKRKKKQRIQKEGLKKEQDNLKKELIALPSEKYFGLEALEKVLVV